MKLARTIELTATLILAICLFGVIKGCYRQPSAEQFDAAIIESVMNWPRQATLAPGEPEPPRVFPDVTLRP